MNAWSSRGPVPHAFRDEGTRDTYLDDPVHKEIGGRFFTELEGGADGVFVFDFEL